MNWERKALIDIINLLVEDEKKRTNLLYKLEELRISVDIEQGSYYILQAIASESWEYFFEDFDEVVNGGYSQEEFSSVAMDFIKKRYVEES